MSISYTEFVSTYETELVGGRLIGTVDGVRCYVAEVADGKFELTDEGRKLLQPQEEAPVEAPRRRGRHAAE